MRQLNETSKRRLLSCKSDLQDLFAVAIEDSPYDFIITHGYRPPEEQRKLYAQGRTKPGDKVTNCDGYINKSKHNYVPSQAVDIAVLIQGKVNWEEKYYKEVARHILKKADSLSIKIKWGGHFKNFKDYPHYETE